MSRNLDQVLADARELSRQRQQRENIKQMVADMATDAEKRRIAEEDWIAPPDVERVPEQLVPDDWKLLEEFRRQPRLAEEAPDDSTAGYTIYVEDTD